MRAGTKPRQALDNYFNLLYNKISFYYFFK